MAEHPLAGRELTVLLPCAGGGRRFGAPYAKELHRVAPDASLVDLALAPAVDLAHRLRRPIRLVVPLTPEKLDTARYLAAYSPVFDIALTYQSDRHGSDLAGAIVAGLPLCSGTVIMLLPDQSFAWDASCNPVETAASQADRAMVVIAAVMPSQGLRHEGALAIDTALRPPTVLRAEESPGDPSGFNAAWAGIVCPPAMLARLPEVMLPGPGSPLEGAAAVLVDGYRNVSEPADVPLPACSRFPSAPPENLRGSVTHD